MKRSFTSKSICPGFINKPALSLAAGLMVIMLQVHAQEIRVNPDRAELDFGQSFNVAFSTNQADAVEPDWTPLRKDFDLVAVQRRASDAGVAGQANNAFKAWTVQLKPKRSGSLLLPPLAFGPYTSPTKPIQVHTRLAQGNAPDFFIQVEALPPSPYVQAEAVLVYRFFMGRILRGNYQLPKVGGETLQPIGSGKNITMQHQGRPYTVHERKFLFRPQASGQAVVEAISLSGHYRHGGVHRPVTVKSPERVLNVRGVPDHYPGRYWLPATQLELSEEPADETWQAGKPFTRVIRLKVHGLAPRQLPALSMPAVKFMKIYSGQPERRKLSQAVYPAVSEQTQKVVFIPSRAGDYVLPAIRLPWWNTREDRLQHAVLPERKIGVDEADETLIAADHYNEAQAELSPLLVEPDHGWRSPWLWLAAFMLVLWLATLFLLLRTRGRSQRRQTDSRTRSDQKRKESLRKHKKRLQAACSSHDAAASAQALIGWIAMLRPDKKLSSLGAIARQYDGALRFEINVLQRALYSDKNDWQGDSLWQAFVKHGERSGFGIQQARGETKEKKRPSLAPLHKLS